LVLKFFLSSAGQYWNGYNFNSRIIVDSSFVTNSGLSSGGTINFQTSDTNNVSANTSKNICTMNTNGVVLNGNLTLQADKWIYSSDSTRQRLFFGSNGATYYQGYGASSWFDINHEWRNNDGLKTMHSDYTGNLIVKGTLNCKFYTVTNTNVI
jgi:hypothetical protein